MFKILIIFNKKSVSMPLQLKEIEDKMLDLEYDNKE